MWDFGFSFWSLSEPNEGKDGMESTCSTSTWVVRSDEVAVAVYGDVKV